LPEWINTSEFYARFLRGEMGDAPDYLVWAGLYELQQRQQVSSG